MIVEKAKHNPIPTILFTIFSVIMIAFSIYALIDLVKAAAGEYVSDPEIAAKIASSLSVVKDAIQNNLGFNFFSLEAVVIIVVGVVVVIILIFLVAMFVTWLMSRIAAEVSILIAFALPVLIFVFAALIFGMTAYFSEGLEYAFLFSGIIAAIGVIVTLFVLWKSRAIFRAGKFIEFSAELIIANKSLYIFPILMAVGAALTTYMASIAGLWITINGDTVLYTVVDKITNETVRQNQELIVRLLTALALFVVEFFYVLFYFVIYYILSGMIMSYAARYYIGEDPGPRTAIRDIRQVMPVIITFATFTTSLHMLLKQIDRLREKTRFPLNIIFGIFHWIIRAFYAFFTYFTLPAIVIKKKGFFSSSVESGKLVWKHGIDVLVSETGFNLVMVVFSYVNKVTWAIVGFSFGSTASWKIANGGLLQNIIIGLVVAVIFFQFLSPISMALIIMPMKSAFTGFLYCYAIGMEEKIKTDRMPDALESDLRAVSKEAIGSGKRKMKNPEAG
ncbi:MAG: hypothetical protein ACFFD4_04255 [Candidatus Odinarchaeota archaeon]